LIVESNIIIENRLERMKHLIVARVNIFNWNHACYAMSIEITEIKVQRNPAEGQRSIFHHSRMLG
jgi:hypothetical protein